MAPDLARARAYATERLTRELSPNLIYHSLGHTREDVLPAALRLAAAAGVGGVALVLLETAALYHDLGFVVQREDHESVSIAVAEAVLPDYGYTPDQLAVIRDLIDATRLPQTPRSFLAEILTDADLDVLGRQDYWARSADLRAEWAAYGVHYTDREWYESQVVFLQGHRYFTPMARAMRSAQKQANLQGLAEVLAGLNGAAPPA